MDLVVHFEMPYENRERLVNFYSQIFGWRMQIPGPEYGGYVLVSTTETDENGMINKTGAINGGFFPMESNSPRQPSVVIAVEDLNDSMKKIAGKGGKVLGEPVDIPGIGKYVAFNDSEGNRVGMLQPKEM